MYSVKLEVETVTPLFIAGADQRNIENEGIRAPSLRGAMRWWFRAAAGGVEFSSGTLNVKEIKEEEEKIWGATDKQSKVAVSISSIDTRISSLQGNRRGIKYLSYGSSDRPCIEPGSRFRLNVHFKPSMSAEEKEKVIATIWLLLSLGNIGSKSRKGFGSLRVAKDVTINGIDFKNPNNIDELEEYLKINVKNCLELFGWNGSIYKSSSLPPYSVIAPNFWKMKILDNTFTSPTDAINDIGEKIREYREDRGNPSARHTRHTRRGTFSYWITKDYNAVKSIYTGGSPSIPQGSIFGLPHQFQFQSINKKAMVRGIQHERRSSPLHVKVWKLDKDRYVAGLQLFKSAFLSEDRLRITDLINPSIRTEVNLPTYNYLENFLNGLSGRWIRL